MQFEMPCYACGRDGSVKMCICAVPFFKEQIIMCYSCDHCGYKSTEVKNGGGISEKATKITLKVNQIKDLNRDIFKSDTCIVVIPEIELSMAPGTLGAIYTTVEGIIEQTHTALKRDNPFGRGDSSTNVKFQAFLEKLEGLRNLS
jgi:zinc finger protein